MNDLDDLGLLTLAEVAHEFQGLAFGGLVS